MAKPLKRLKKKVVKKNKPVNKPSPAEDRQSKAVEFELMRQEVANIDKQIQELQLRQVDLMAIKQSLDSIKEGRDKELLVPLGTGVYINSSLTNDKTVLVNVGAGIVVEKDFNDAASLIDEQINAINNAVMELDANAEEFIRRMQQIELSLSA